MPEAAQQDAFEAARLSGFPDDFPGLFVVSKRKRTSCDEDGSTAIYVRAPNTIKKLG